MHFFNTVDLARGLTTKNMRSVFEKVENLSILLLMKLKIIEGFFRLSQKLLYTCS